MDRQTNFICRHSSSIPPAGYEVVPAPEAKQLASYLLSLKAGAPLYEASFTQVMAKP